MDPRHNINRKDAELYKFRSYQKSINAAFANYRDGNLNARDYRTTIRQDVLDSMKHPSVADRKKVDHKVIQTKPELDKIRKDIKLRDYRINKRYSLGNLAPNERPATRNKINFVARRLFRAGIRFRRILSCGGMGMAALFETQNSVTGLYNKCVAKISLLAGEQHNMEREKAMTRLLSGAPHIVQMLTVDQLRALPGGYKTQPVGGDMPDDPTTCHKSDDDATLKNMVHSAKDVMILEFLPFGSLDHWIAKSEQLGVGFSNEVCWHLLLCLAKACLAMKYPTACQPKDLPVEADLDRYTPQAKKKVQPVAGIDPDSDEDDDDDGRAVPASVSEVHNIVHFDLDPSNVLVDASNEGCGKVCGNARIPKLKVADFGIAVDGSKVDFDDAKVAWNNRFCGKPVYYAPEQWTAEWMAVTDNPRADGAEIAGQYGEKTNVYQVGLILQAIMLRKAVNSTPHISFVPMRSWQHPNFPQHLNDPDEFEGAVQDAIKTKKPNGVQMIPTVAWMLNDKLLRAEWWAKKVGGKKQAPKPTKMYEWRLREMVMRCAAYEPHVRPSAAELVRLVEARLADGGFGDGAAEAELLFAEANKPVEPQPKRAYKNLIGAVGGE